MKQTNAKQTWVSKDTLRISCYSPLKKDKSNYWRCDSGLEAYVLTRLMQTLHKPWEIYLHPTITVAAFNHSERLEGYDLNKWKPDFILKNGTNKIIVEVKGRIFYPFPYQYALCRRSYPQIPIFIIKNVKGVDDGLTLIHHQLLSFSNQ